MSRICEREYAIRAMVCAVVALAMLGIISSALAGGVSDTAAATREGSDPRVWMQELHARIQRDLTKGRAIALVEFFVLEVAPVLIELGPEAGKVHGTRLDIAIETTIASTVDLSQQVLASPGALRVASDGTRSMVSHADPQVDELILQPGDRVLGYFTHANRGPAQDGDLYPHLVEYCWLRKAMLVVDGEYAVIDKLQFLGELPVSQETEDSFGLVPGDRRTLGNRVTRQEVVRLLEPSFQVLEAAGVEVHEERDMGGNEQ